MARPDMGVVKYVLRFRVKWNSLARTTPLAGRATQMPLKLDAILALNLVHLWLVMT